MNSRSLKGYSVLLTLPEGGGSEGVGDGGVDGVVVSPVVAPGQQPQLEDLEHPRPQDDGQPLVVGDVLDHGPDVSPDIIIIIIIIKQFGMLFRYLVYLCTRLIYLVSRNTLSSDQWGLRLARLRATLLCSLSHSVWMVASPGCSLTL